MADYTRKVAEHRGLAIYENYHSNGEHKYETQYYLIENSALALISVEVARRCIDVYLKRIGMKDDQTYPLTEF